MARAWAFLRVIFGRHELTPESVNQSPRVDSLTSMRNLIVSGVKTAVQVGVAAFIGWLTTLGIDVTGEAAVALETGVFAVATGVITVLLNWVGERWPIVNRIVSLGISNQTASYTGPGG